MQNIYDVIKYNEDFIERITSEIFSVHNLWKISPLQNPVKELLSGNTSEVEKFSNFFQKHIENEYPFALLITIGNSEKNYSQLMLTRNRTIIKVKFDQYHPNYIGTPLNLSNFTSF